VLAHRIATSSTTLAPTPTPRTTCDVPGPHRWVSAGLPLGCRWAWPALGAVRTCALTGASGLAVVAQRSVLMGVLVFA